jgi:hypothetical protein
MQSHPGGDCAVVFFEMQACQGHGCTVRARVARDHPGKDGGRAGRLLRRPDCGGLVLLANPHFRLCHAERSEASSGILLRASIQPDWMSDCRPSASALHFVQNDNLGFKALPTPPGFLPAPVRALRGKGR